MIMEVSIRTPIEWARYACDSIMDIYRPEELPPARRWHYHQGVFLCGMEMLAERVNEPKYEAYIQGYVDGLVDDCGNLYAARDELDAIQAGLLLFRLHERTGKPKYRLAADRLRGLFDTFNKTTEGGFWHKDKYPYQMWLDGLYMGGVFALKYDRAYRDDRLKEMVLLQERLMRKAMKDERTGLLYHAWDESREMPWANNQTGCSPEFWGRSLGWYGLALAEFLSVLRRDEEAEPLAVVQREFLHSLIRYQDKSSGLWYQVVDKGHNDDNWLETSCTSLFVHAIARGIRQGVIGDECLDAAMSGYHGLISRMEQDEQGRLVMPDICIGTSAGDYENYVTRPTSRNDLHGVGAFIMACAAINDLLDSNR
ncbi:glycoside hydrolase family 105 protein [Paenibacillus sp. BC26]|uniref:glycoside hydrolase family 88/105 protein n=1 Tax=Paenibacillus sp. BC26 TaxID=1881032 RepID=UPI0008EA6849|nr:glycoside hydrolase family 88 protein [Paenibacillus sp. BC26]SFT04983.1 unsaturated rhamnogalacturonyl hydrolase [Paenibacillus sp. BC26]